MQNVATHHLQSFTSLQNPVKNLAALMNLTSCSSLTLVFIHNKLGSLRIGEVNVSSDNKNALKISVSHSAVLVH